MADTSIGQVQAFFGSMSSYFGSVSTSYQDATKPSPNFMEILPTFGFAQILTESQQLAKGNPTMVSGALIESASAIFATLREAGMRAKIRSDFFSESGGAAGDDSNFYREQGQSMVSFINGRNDMQS